MINNLVKTLKNDDVKSISREELYNLDKLAKKKRLNKYRICSHQARDKIHEMFIYHEKDYFVHPHLHKNKSESLFMIKGIIDYLTFDKFGNLLNVYSLSNMGKNKLSYIKIKPNIYHSMIIRSKSVIFLEITKGPFLRRDTVYTKWYNHKFVDQYSSELKRRVKMFKKHEK